MGIAPGSRTATVPICTQPSSHNHCALNTLTHCVDASCSVCADEKCVPEFWLGALFNHEKV